MSSYIYFEEESVKYLEPKHTPQVDLFLNYCGVENCPPSYGFGPAVRDHYLIHYILEGKGKYTVGDSTYYLEKNQGFIINPNTLTYYEADENEPWTYIWIAFNGIKSQDYLSSINLDSNNLIFHCEENELLKNYVMDMFKINRMSVSGELKLQGLLYLFLSTLAQSSDSKSTTNSDVSYKLYIEKSIEFINNNYTNNIKVTDIADYVGLNRSYLSSLFKKTLNLSPQELLLKFRMNKACELLKIPEHSVGDVSRSVGYTDPLTFSKVFKKFTGHSPKQYRENLTQK